MTSYELSRNFWDFSFENTGKIKPIHVAIYFFAIEHCNRLGWKRNFGLPTSMVLEAISVKSYSVYKSAFDDLVEFDFFEVVQYSKNQYSSNIIALKDYCKANDKAPIKALDKAMTKHSVKQPSKQHQSNMSIDKPNNLLTIEPITTTTWRDSFDIYREELISAFNNLGDDPDWMIKQEKFNPNIDIFLSIGKAITNFWDTPDGWKNKKASKTKEINWKSTLANSISQPMNKVYKQKTDAKTFNNNTGGKLAGNYQAAEQLASEIREKSKRFEDRMQDTT